MEKRQGMKRIKGKVKNKKDFLPAFVKFLEEADELEFEINAGIAEKVGEEKWIERAYDGHTTILLQTYHKDRDKRDELFKKSEEVEEKYYKCKVCGVRKKDSIKSQYYIQKRCPKHYHER